MIKKIAALVVLTLVLASFTTMAGQKGPPKPSAKGKKVQTATTQVRPAEITKLQPRR